MREMKSYRVKLKDIEGFKYVSAPTQMNVIIQMRKLYIGCAIEKIERIK